MNIQGCVLGRVLNNPVECWGGRSVPDLLRDEAVAESSGGGTDSPIPYARWQQGEQFMRGV